MKHLLTLCLLAVTMCAVAQEQVPSKRIAILETVDKEGTVPYGVKLQLRQSITFAISRTLGYEAYNRVERGGRYDGIAKFCRVSDHTGGDPNFRTWQCGFRVVVLP